MNLHHTTTQFSFKAQTNSWRPWTLLCQLPVISPPDDNIPMTSLLSYHLTDWVAAAVIARPLIVIGDCAGMVIMVSNCVPIVCVCM